MKLKRLIAFILLTAAFFTSANAQNFHEPRRISSKINDVISRLEDSLKRQFESKNLNWPPSDIYVRSFKYDRQLEVWVKNKSNEPFRLFKTYKVCMQSGSMGPKRMEGDYQVPEGFYHINDFNTNSVYHLSLGLNYPNASDRLLSDSLRPGSNIYIHGNCVSTGCIPLGDAPIEEVFYIANSAHNAGQDFIPVHVFPVRYNVKKSFEHLKAAMEKNPSLASFNSNIRSVFDYFESKKELPLIMVNKKGEYVIN